MLAFSIILFTFRPRRNWPEFYGVDIDAARNSIYRSKQRPIMQARITGKTVFDDFATIEGPVENIKRKKKNLKKDKQHKHISNMTAEGFDEVMLDLDGQVKVGPRDMILVINPCEMTLEDQGDSSSDHSGAASDQEIQESEGNYKV